MSLVRAKLFDPFFLSPSDVDLMEPDEFLRQVHGLTLLLAVWDKSGGHSSCATEVCPSRFGSTGHGRLHLVNKDLNRAAARVGTHHVSSGVSSSCSTISRGCTARSIVKMIGFPVASPLETLDAWGVASSLPHPTATLWTVPLEVPQMQFFDRGMDIQGGKALNVPRPAGSVAIVWSLVS